MEDISKNLIHYIHESESALKILRRFHFQEIQSIDVQRALIEVLKLESPSDLLNQDLTTEKIVEYLLEFDFKKYYPEIIFSIELEYSIIPDGIPRLLTEKQIFHKNEIWIIYKNDVDPFPSNPHAHNYESNLKLDLSNGNLYQKRKCVGKIKKKVLIKIRSKADKIDLPKLNV